VSSPPATGNNRVTEQVACGALIASVLGILIATSAASRPLTNTRVLLFALLGVVAVVLGIGLYSRFKQDGVQLGKVLAAILIFAGLLSAYIGAQPLLARNPPGDPNENADTVDPAQQFAAGVALFQQGQYRQAIDKFKEAARDQSKQFDANAYMGQCYLKLREYKAAKEPLHAAYGLKANDEIKHLLAQAYYSSGVEYLNNRDKHGAVREQEFLKDYDSGMAEKLADLIEQP
jgi:tetratricopeptide (TPR) repeat protein